MQDTRTYLLCGILSLAMSVVPRVDADTHYVATNGLHNPPFTNWVDAATNIQAGVNAAGDGDVVLVRPGIYSEGEQIEVANGITLASTGGGLSTAMVGAGHRCLHATHSNAVINGFTLTLGADPGGGNAARLSSGATIQNSLIAHNGHIFTGGFGAVYLTENSRVESCTIVKNIKGGVLLDNGGKVVNSIVYDNDTNIDTLGGGWSVNHSCTIPDPGGTNNITDDPWFTNSDSGNFHLRSASPCINIGTNQAWMTGAVDLDGEMRIDMGVVDLGVDEFRTIPCYPQSPHPSLSILRGPYLQRGSPTGMVVCWRTDVPTNGTVHYGLVEGMLTNCATSAAFTNDHVVELYDLIPCTNYYYSVGTVGFTVSGGGTNHSFSTSPPNGTRKPTRIWVLGDSGTANQNARDVRDAFYLWNSGRHPDLWLMLGDNAYVSGTDNEYQNAVFNTYPATLANSVLWPTLGNHDGFTADSATLTGPYYDIFSLPRSGECGGTPSGTEAYYSFDYANMHFICLESFETDRSTNGAMIGWMISDLAVTTQEWIIAFWHHPPYSKGSHDSDFEGWLVDMRQNALPFLEAGGVDLVLCGHSHSYERSYQLHGHYDVSWNLDPDVHIINDGDGRMDGEGAYHKIGTPTGTVYIVAGSSGMISGGSFDHPVMFVSFSRLGSLVIDVNGSRMDVAFIENTPVVGDSFTILKAPDGFSLTGTSPGGGWVDPSIAYFSTGIVAGVHAEAMDYHVFDNWSGDASGSVNPTSVLMNADKSVTANFHLPLATNEVPVLWLQEHGHGTNAADVLSDVDLDGLNASDEFHAGTIPTNGESVMRIEGLERDGSNLTIRWQSAPGQQYDLLSSDDPDGFYSTIVTGLPADPAEFSGLPAGTNQNPSKGYFRLETYR